MQIFTIEYLKFRYPIKLLTLCSLLIKIIPLGSTINTKFHDITQPTPKPFYTFPSNFSS